MKNMTLDRFVFAEPYQCPATFNLGGRSKDGQKTMIIATSS